MYNDDGGVDFFYVVLHVCLCACVCVCVCVVCVFFRSQNISIKTGEWGVLSQ